jgi:hypothetical protein
MSTESDTMDIQRGVALTLSECIAWELCTGHNFQQISEVVTESEVQHKLESSIHEQILMWCQMTFQFEEHEKKTLFSSMTQILDALDESQVSLKSILSSKFCTTFKADCLQLSLNLSRVRALLEVWSNVQELFCKLESIYSTSEISSCCSRGFPIFERESRRWMSSVEVVANRPSVFYACGLYDLSGEALEDTDIYDVKKEYALSLQEGFLAAQQEITLYLDSKRVVWPRLFAVSSETMMSAISQPIPSKNSFWPSLFMSVFSSVEMVSTERLDASVSITLSDRTKLSLHTALNFNDKLELWLLKLNNALSFRMLESIRTVLLDFGLQDSALSTSSNIFLPPAKGRGQVVAVSDWAIWCSKISRALSDAVFLAPQFGHPHDIIVSSGHQESISKSLEALSTHAKAEIESCSIVLMQPNAMMHHRMLQIQRLIMCAWVQDLITDIQSSSRHAVSAGNCWAWASIVRYHVGNSKNHEPEYLSVRICDLNTNFGYELIAQASGYSLFPVVCMTDRMRLVCSLAVSASACIQSTIIGPSASGKSTTINLLAFFYGRFVATLPCCSSLEIAGINKFVELAVHSCNVATVCCIEDIDLLKLHVFSHLSASLRQINQMISDRARAHFSASSQFSFIFCTMGCEQINQKPNVFNLAKSFSRTVRIIEIDRVALVACVLKGVGFSSYDFISQKLQVFFQQISTSFTNRIATHLSSFAVISQILHSIMTTWSDARSEREFDGINDSSAREVQCVVASLMKVFQPFLSACGNDDDFTRVVFSCFGVSLPLTCEHLPNVFPSCCDQCRVLLYSIGVHCDHHLQTAIDLWNSMITSALPSPYLILVGPDSCGRNFSIALFELLSIHYSQLRFQRFSVCSSQGPTEIVMQHILTQVDRSQEIFHMDCVSSEFRDSEMELFSLSQPLPSDAAAWLIVFLQSCTLAQNFGNGRAPNIREKIRQSARFITIQSDVTIIHQHARNKYLYIVVTGQLMLAGAHKSCCVGPGHVVGDFSAINGINSVCSVVSTSQCSLIMVPSHVFCCDSTESQVPKKPPQSVF